MDIERLIGSQCRRDWERTDPDDVATVRVAAVGLGWFTRGRALPALADSDRCEPTVLVSGSPGKAERVAAEAAAAQKAKPKGLRTVTRYEVADHRALLHWIARNHPDDVTAFVEEWARKHHREHPAADGLRVWQEKEAY